MAERAAMTASGGPCVPSARHAARRWLPGSWLTMLPAPAAAQVAASDAATIAELRRQLEEMRQRLEQLEARAAAAPRPTTRHASAARVARRSVHPPAPRPGERASGGTGGRGRGTRRGGRGPGRAAGARRRAATRASVPGLDPPEPMGRDFATEEALRSDLPGVAFRVPGTETQVRAVRLRQADRLLRFRTAATRPMRRRRRPSR